MPPASPIASGRKGTASERKGKVPLRHLEQGLAQTRAGTRQPEPARGQPKGPSELHRLPLRGSAPTRHGAPRRLG
eukprot:8857272-Alexandrium_andersonii.AAC.1